MARFLIKADIVGHRITQIWQTITINDESLDRADNVFSLDNGVKFRLPFDRTGRIAAVDVPEGAVLFDDPQTAPMLASPIVDLKCPEDDRYADYDTSFLLLESGLWISQVAAFPTGPLAIGLFAGMDCPWDERDDHGRLVSYFEE